MASWVPSAVAAGAGIGGVIVGGLLSQVREDKVARRQRGWESNDRLRSERRDAYVRFLVGCDTAIAVCWETGRKRTSVHTMEDGQQHWADWAAARDALLPLLTQIELSATSEIHALAQRYVSVIDRFGNESLVPGKAERTPAEASAECLVAKAVLVAAVREDLDS